jgi:hypothetical protein
MDPQNAGILIQCTVGTLASYQNIDVCAINIDHLFIFTPAAVT